MTARSVEQRVAAVAGMVELAIHNMLASPGKQKTPDEYAAWSAARHARQQAWADLRRTENTAFAAALAEIPDAGLRRVVEHHSPDESADCEGCDGWSHEDGAPRWPCSTALLVASLYDIAVPTTWDEFFQTNAEPTERTPS